VHVDGDDREWPDRGAFEDEGLSLQAMNDGSDVYLKVTSSTKEGRAQLTGAARQDATFWFYAGDGKTRSWGLRIPFSRMPPPQDDDLRDGPVFGGTGGLQPELLEVASVPSSTGTVVSTAAWPTDVEFRLGYAGHRPVWELRMPLKRLTPDKDRRYPVDFVITGKSARLHSVPRPTPAPAPEAVGRKGRDHAHPDAHEEVGVPEPMAFILSLRLAEDPALAR